MAAYTREGQRRIEFYSLGGGGGGGGGGAPTNGPYITWEATGALSNEAVFGATVFYPPDTLANRPAASATIVGAIYFATNGGGSAGQGILYRSDGVSVWEAIAIDKEYADALYQPVDATLTALAGLTTGANLVPYFTGTDTAATFTASALGRAFAGMSRDTFSNAAKVVSDETRVLAQTGTMSASRAVTLPAASDYTAGTWLLIVDESGTVTVSNTIVVTRAGADTINGLTTYTMGTPYGWVILESDGSAKWTVVSAPSVVNVQEFSGSGTWTKPPNALAVHVHLVGGGGGGGGGRLGAAGTTRFGGGGGGAGGVADILVPASILGATESVTIGAGGTSGTGPTGPTAANGGSGGDGGTTSVGTSSVLAISGGGLLAIGLGNGGTDVGSSAYGSIGTQRMSNTVFGSLFGTANGGPGGAGSNGTGGTTGAVGWTPGGGGGGGGVSGGNVETNGGSGSLGQPGTGATVGTGGTAPGGNGTNATSPTDTETSYGAGAGGGAGENTNTLNAGNGGNGSQPGGGAGGGGGGTSGSTGKAGNGGVGGAGYAVLVTFCGRSS